MKKISITLTFLACITMISVQGQDLAKIKSTKTHIKFFSTTAAEDIEANNYSSISTLNKETGDVVFSVPMQSFEFEKALMQKHFNSDKFLDSKAFPKAKLKGKTTNISEVDFAKDGTYPATVDGELTIKGKTNAISETGTITVKGGVITVTCVFKVTLSDYDITFSKGKPSTNIAKEVEVTVVAVY